MASGKDGLPSLYTRRTVAEDIQETEQLLAIQREWHRRMTPLLAPFREMLVRDVGWDRLRRQVGYEPLSGPPESWRLTVPLVYVGKGDDHISFRAVLKELRQRLELRSISWRTTDNGKDAAYVKGMAKPHLIYKGSSDRFWLSVEVPWLMPGCEAVRTERFVEVQSQLLRREYRISCALR